MAAETLLKTGWKPIIDPSGQPDRLMDNTSFDPAVHLAYQAPSHIHMMTDLGYKEDTGISPVAASEPFQLFSEDAIRRFRAEIFQPQVMSECGYSGSLGACMIRGYAPKHGPFVYDAWHHPETLKIVSEIAGVDLVPSMDFEIAHINISVKSEAQAGQERESHAQTSKSMHDSPIVGWHNDSYPFVCVTMLSDCTGMIGGETALRMADGNVMRVRGPSMGCAVVLQGRYVTHQALRALGAQERVTMVTSFRPQNPLLTDSSVLDTVRGVSDLSELYYGFGTYRLEMLGARIAHELSKLKQGHADGRRTDTRALKHFLEDSIGFLQHTDSEIVQDEDVVPGHQPTLGIEDVKVVASTQEPAKAKL